MTLLSNQANTDLGPSNSLPVDLPESNKKNISDSGMYEAHFHGSPLRNGKMTVNWWERYAPAGRWITGRSYLRLKRLFDLITVVAVLPFVVPILTICALCIKIESPHGPLLFGQERIGKDGKRFKMYKFRTMVPNAEALKSKYAHLNELEWPDFKITNDPRITQVGKLLRKSSLDELPQIFNVLKGEMSLVGPRPTSIQLEKYEPWQTVRLEAKPGLTGLWQVTARSTAFFDQKVKLDYYYLQRQSFWLDLVIIARTFGVLLQGK